MNPASSFCFALQQLLCLLFICSSMPAERSYVFLLKRPAEPDFKPKENTDLMPESSLKPPEWTFHLTVHVVLLFCRWTLKCYNAVRTFTIHQGTLSSLARGLSQMAFPCAGGTSFGEKGGVVGVTLTESAASKNRSCWYSHPSQLDNTLSSDYASWGCTGDQLCTWPADSTVEYQQKLTLIDITLPQWKWFTWPRL